MSKNAKYIYIVSCQDATHLGGPMGSEFTTEKWWKMFTTRAKALAFAEQYVKKSVRDPSSEKPTVRHRYHVAWDIGYEIINVHREKVN